MNSGSLTVGKKPFWKRLRRDLSFNRFAYFLIIPAVVLTIIFHYFPLWGVKLAFQQYNIYSPETSPWCGLDNFITIFKTPGLVQAIINTLLCSVIGLVTGFPLEIMFALALNEVRNTGFKKVTQTISYLPHFLSTMAVVGLATTMFSMYGPINDIIDFLGGERTMFLAQQNMFLPIITIVCLWKNTGWNSIIYLSAISGVDPTLYEAVAIDGGGRWRQIWHVTLPCIRPTIIILLIYKFGGLFGSTFEIVYGFQNPFVNFENISTIIYKRGIEGGQYGISTAMGLFQGVIGFILLYIANFTAKKVSETSLF